jgi:hypothetical protein
MCEALLAEVAHQALGPVEVAVEDDDPLEALADEGRDHGSRRAAGAEHHSLAGHLLLADDLVQGDLEAGHVGVVADELLAVARDHVHRAGGLSIVGQPVHHRHDVFLVRNGHVRPEEFVASKLGDRFRKVDLPAVPQLVPGVDFERVEGSLLHGGREGMGDRVADEDDSVGHACSLSSSVKKLGYETAALSARSIEVEPEAMRPATANVIASRWSSRVWVEPRRA